MNNSRDEPNFEHQRHKPPQDLSRPRGLVVACAPMRSQVNLSRIARAAGCMGVTQIIAAGRATIDRKIARDAADNLHVANPRTLAPALAAERDKGFRIVGLEQTTDSQNLFDYQFAYQSVLVVGNERSGLTDELLAKLDDVVEIPVFGMPFSLNAATATCMAIYEYCRQYPLG